ncbi:MAG: Recombinase [Candidatus Collierbacteria bacterium GW2011_GWC2_44_18]|uniref:Recombinase n=1 Tax=Candidatus Collierbacteria bacterium GW2011_GWC2_44_18 TaxID=1618392 RepID=A0A0G1HS11_9BACT|nr:MAG: Recombinase [Candidatus Collierbacteria bacterium GW2011_GWC2_44_18]
MKAVIYLRKSTDESDRQVLSLDSQKEICENVAKRYNLQVIETLVESASAKEAFKRPQFQKLINFIQKKKAEAIIAWKPNRLARNATEGGMLIDLLNSRKLAIFCDSGEYTRGDSTLLHIEFGFSTKYSQDLSDDVKVGMLSKANKGWRPGKACLGYKNIGEIKGEKTIIVDPKISPFIKRMFDLAVTGKSVHDIQKIITDEGLRIPAAKSRPSRPIGKTQCYRLLTNEFYYGWFYWKGEFKKGVHEPIISQETFDMAQRVLSSKSKKQKFKNNYWWMGLLKCWKCGGAITAEVKQRKRTDGSFRFHEYARCTKKKGVCSEKYTKVEDLEKQLKNFLYHSYIDPTKIEKIKAKIREKNESELTVAKIRLSDKTKKLQNLFERKKTLFQMKGEGLIDSTRYLEELNKITVEENGVNTSDLSLDSWAEDLDKAIDFATHASEMFKNGDNETKRQIVRILGEDLVMGEQKVWCKAKYTFKQMSEWVDEGIDEVTSLLGQKSTHELGVTNEEQPKVSG